MVYANAFFDCTVQIDLKQQYKATHDAVASEDPRNCVDEVQNEPNQRMYEPENSRETAEATSAIARRQINDKCNQTRHLQNVNNMIQ